MGDRYVDAIFERYKYARHMYGCLFEASQSGQTCFDPLFYHYGFPMDGIEDQFIFANAIKVAPIMQDYSETELLFPVFFPPGSWVNLDDFSVVRVNKTEGETIAITTKEEKIIKHLMPGAILAVQYNTSEQGQQERASSTDQLNYTDIHLIINKDDQHFAGGKLFLDGG